jgi:hypothetical protein
MFTSHSPALISRAALVETLSDPRVNSRYEQSALFPGDSLPPEVLREILFLYEESSEKYILTVITDLISSPRRTLLAGIIAQESLLIGRFANAIFAERTDDLSCCRSSYFLKSLGAVANYRDPSNRAPFFTKVWGSGLMFMVRDLFDRLYQSRILESIVEIFAKGEVSDHVHLYSLFKTAYPETPCSIPPCWEGCDRSGADAQFAEFVDKSQQLILCLLFARTWMSAWGSVEEHDVDAVKGMFCAFLPWMRMSPLVRALGAPGSRLTPFEPIVLQFLGLLTDLDFRGDSVYGFVLEKVASSPFLGAPVHVAALRYLARCCPQRLPDRWNAKRVLENRVRPILLPPLFLCEGYVAPNSFSFRAANELARVFGGGEDTRAVLREWAEIGWAQRNRGSLYGTIFYRGALFEIARIVGKEAGGEDWRRWFEKVVDRQGADPETEVAPGEVSDQEEKLTGWWLDWVEEFVDADGILKSELWWGLPDGLDCGDWTPEANRRQEQFTEGVREFKKTFQTNISQQNSGELWDDDEAGDSDLSDATWS